MKNKKVNENPPSNTDKDYGWGDKTTEVNTFVEDYPAKTVITGKYQVLEKDSNTG